MAEAFRREQDDEAFGGAANDFKNRCYTFLVILCNDKDMDAAAKYLSPDCVLVHEDFPPIRGPKAFIEAWRKNLEKMPNYHKDIRDMVVEKEEGESGGSRIWVYSRISGIHDDNLTDSIDMMRFTFDGLFRYSKDVQRVVEAREE